MIHTATIPGEGLAMTSGPSVEVMTTAVAKNHARVTRSDEDTLIDSYIVAARRKVERDTGLQLITATWVWKIADFPGSDILFVPRNPLQSVTSITYVDTAGDTQTLATSVYDLGLTSKRGRIALAWSESWPTVRRQIDAVTITFVAGFGDASADVDEDLILANQMLVAHWYEFREPVIEGGAPMTVPLGYDNLIAHHRTQFF